MGSYCGADGVDDWDEAKWSEEISENQVGRFPIIYFIFFFLRTGSRAGTSSIFGSYDPLVLQALRCCSAYYGRVPSCAGDY